MTDAVIRQVRTELGPRATLGAAAVSQYLAAAGAAQVLGSATSPEFLRRDFSQDRYGTMGRVYPLAEHGCRRETPAVLDALRAEDLLAAGHPLASFSETRYLERVVHLALERLLVNPAAPPLLIAPLPEPGRTAVLRRRPVVAVLFDHPLGITHELYPLCTDAFVSLLGAPESGASFELVGVHSSWLEAGGRANRAMLFDPDLDLFLETPLEAPVPLAAALLLCQSRQAHQRLGAQLLAWGVPHLNPYFLAATADDKWSCWARWSDRNVRTPPTSLLSRQASAGETRAAVSAFVGEEQRRGRWRQGWVVQPRYGTEGDQVTWAEPGPAMTDALVQAWQSIADSDDAILRPRVGVVCLGSDAGPLPFDLRVHVSCDGAAYAAESGYLLVAPAAAAPITSVARGGQAQPLSRLEEAGLVLADGTPVPWTPEDLGRVCDLAVHSVQAVGPLGFAGVDVKLDLCRGRLEPSVLDLNPRPSGLLHADLFANRQAGLSPGLWRRVGSLLAASTGAALSAPAR